MLNNCYKSLRRLCQTTLLKHFLRTNLLSDSVDFMVSEVVIAIKVLVFKHSLADDTVSKLSFDVHHQFQHLVVCLPREHYLACVQLVDRHGNGPQIDTVTVTHP